MPVTRRRALSAGIAAAAVPRGANAMTIGELYGEVTADGLQLSAPAKALIGKPVRVTGYMAPPLKAESDFFVLTRYPMSVCPFCSNAADWPADIVVVNLRQEAEMLSPSYAIQVEGTLDVGPKIDAETGFVSLVRVTGATWRRI